MIACALRVSLVVAAVFGTAAPLQAQKSRAGKPIRVAGIKWHDGVDAAVKSQAKKSAKKLVLWLRTLGGLGGGL